MSITLRWPKFDDIENLKKAHQENWEKGFPFLHNFETLASSSYEKYIDILPKFSDRDIIPKEHVPATFLLAFNEKNEVVGRVSIRHELNDALKIDGGHIGYGVAPSHRNNGYATSILSHALKYIKTNLPSLKEVILTCDDNNIGSYKVIEKNNGKLIERYKHPVQKNLKRRYCIYL